MMNLVGFNTTATTNDKYTASTTQELNNNMDIITQKGRDMVMARIADMLRQKPIISERIAEARSQGGLEENEELHMALEELQRVDVEINRLNSIVTDCVILPKLKAGPRETVTAGSTVRIEDFTNDRIIEYTILGEVESDPANGIINHKAPLAKLLLGCYVGDVVDMKRGDDWLEYEVLEIFIKEEEA